MRKIWHFINSQIRKSRQKARARRLINQWTAQDEKALAFYRQFIPEDSLCFDIGANIGLRSKLFSRLAGRVVAVEPQPSCLESLDFLKKKCPNVEVLNLAVADKDGTGVLHVSNATVLSTMSPKWKSAVTETKRFGDGAAWTNEIQVKTVTLDNLIQSYGVPAFIKIDVEGFEVSVLGGLNSKVGSLSMEFTPECCDDAIKCVKRLIHIGYEKFNLSLGESFQLEFADWVTGEDLEEKLRELSSDTRVFGDIYVEA